MKPLLVKAVTTLAAAAGLSALMPVSQASAIGYVDCSTQGSVRVVFKTGGRLCFAGVGETGWLAGWDRIYSGKYTLRMNSENEYKSYLGPESTVYCVESTCYKKKVTILY